MGAALLVPAAISALSAGVGIYNQRQALARQNAAAVQGLLAQQQLQDQAASRINQQLDQLQRSGPQAPAAQSAAAFTAALQRARASAQGATPQVAGADPRYAQAIASGAAPYTATENQQAQDAAQMMAPTLQRQSEQSGIESLAAALGELATQSRARAGLTQLAVGSVQPNPWLTALAAAGSGAASGAASKYFYGNLFPAATGGRSVPVTAPDGYTENIPIG